MKKLSGIFAFLCFSIICSSAAAQVVDMRAFSRQRGYKAYQNERRILRPAVVNSAVSLRPDDGNAEKQTIPSPVGAGTAEREKEPSGDQTEEFLKYIEENPHVKPDI